MSSPPPTAPPPPPPPPIRIPLARLRLLLVGPAPEPTCSVVEHGIDNGYGSGGYGSGGYGSGGYGSGGYGSDGGGDCNIL
uniref:Uncharacterized protein n=1 Tax=Globodera pallida TaxID=36090 RepID=A0A183CFY7_GLOPA